MILLVTRRDSIHANLVEKALQQRNTHYLRLNVDRFQEEFSAFMRIKDEKPQGYISSSHTHIPLENIKSVWWYDFPPPYIDTKEISTEYQEWARMETHNGLLWILSSLQVYYLNDPLAIDSASIKSKQLITAARLGFDIPDSIITRNTRELREFYGEHENIIFKTIVPISREKDIKSRTIFTTIVKEEDITNNGAVETKLNFFQEYIPKAVEIRATIVGEKVLAAEIHSQKSTLSKIDWTP